MWVGAQKQKKGVLVVGIATIAMVTFKGHLRHSVSRHKDSVAEVVFGDRVDCERKEKFVKSSTGARSKFESKDILVYPDAYTR